MTREYDIAVAGGGPAGIMAALAAAAYGKKTVLIEKNDRPGRKLLLTGNGRCNITFAEDVFEAVTRYLPRYTFMYHGFSVFSNRDLLDFFREKGIQFKREGEKIFPVKDSAAEINDTLIREMKARKVELWKGTAMTGFVKTKQGFLLRTDKGEIRCNRLVLAGGGASYPETGSTGEMLKMAENAGHDVNSFEPGLTGFVVSDKRFRELQGISLDDAEVRLLKNCRKNKVCRGSLLFTHFGVSGSAVMELSRQLRTVPKDILEISIDFLPAESSDYIIAGINRYEEENPQKSINGFLERLFPRRLSRFLSEDFFDGGKTKVSSMDSKRKEKFSFYLKDYRIRICGKTGLSRAIISLGGVETSEINPSTMESLKIPGLFFAGEIIDCDGPTGGYNLQQAFTTGYLAGNSAAGH